MLTDSKFFMESALSVVNIQGTVFPFRLNPVQEKLHKNFSGRDIILKARRCGISTYVCARFFHHIWSNPNTTTTILSHDPRSCRALFSIMKRFIRFLPQELRPIVKRNNDNELVILFREGDTFHESNTYVGTARMEEFGRADHITCFHGSEVAFWPRAEKILTAAMNAVPPVSKGGSIVLESTPNGIGGFFHELYNEAKSRTGPWRSHFFPWFTFPEYKMELLKDESYDPKPEEREMGLSQEQIKWRRTMMEAHHPKELFFQEYPENDYDCFLRSGRPVFDQNILKILLSRTQNTKTLQNPRNQSLKHLVKEGLKIYRKPTAGHIYVIGVDTSSGSENSDRSVVAVLDRTDAVQAAEWAGLISPHALAELAARVGIAYNYALLAVERQNHGHAVLSTLSHNIKYPNLYRFKDYDPITGCKGLRKLGWDTNARSRPVMLFDLVDAVEHGHLKVMSYDFVGECLSFVYLRNGRMGAQHTSERGVQGRAYDDRVMAWAIAWQVRKLQAARRSSGREYTKFHPTRYYLDWVRNDEDRRKNQKW